MKEIILSKGMVAFVDDEDYERVNAFNWWYSTGYARRETREGGKRSTVTLQDFIYGPVAEGCTVDHENRNRLDCRRGNLREATRKEQQENRGKWSGGTSRYKGVSWHSVARKWMAVASSTYLGLFPSEGAAAIAYNRYAALVQGEFCVLNVVKTN
jgi:hypothetical protein